MKSLIIIIQLFFFLTITLSAQVKFQKVYSDTAAGGGFALETSNQEYILSGGYHSWGSSSENIFFIKTDSVGDTLWTRSISSFFSGYVQGVNLEFTSDSNLILFGRSVQNSNVDFYLAKLDINGDTIWTRGYNKAQDDRAMDGKTTKDGGYVMTGWTYDGFSNQAYIIKADSNGNLMWTKTFDNFAHSLYGTSVIETSDSNLVITMSHGSVLKLNSSGDTIWTKFYTSPQSHIAFERVKESNDGNYILLGGKTDSLSTESDILLMKVDVNGNILWTNSYSTPNTEIGNSIEETPNGDFFISGSACQYSSDIWADTCLLLLLKINSSGNINWVRTYGDVNDFDRGSKAFQATDGGILISGDKSNQSSNLNGALLIKTDSLGSSGCSDQIFSLATSSPTVFTNQYPIVVGFGGQQNNFHSALGNRGTPNTLCSSVGFTDKVLSNKSEVIFPNPANSVFFFEGSDYIKGQLQIYNAVGLKIFASEINNNSMTIDCRDFVDGIYFVKVSNQTGYSDVLKVIVDH